MKHLLAPVGRVRNLSDNNGQFLEILDSLALLPEIKALDENAVLVKIEEGFEIVDRTFKGQSIEEMKYHLISAVNDRIDKIEKELLDKRKMASVSVEKSGEPSSPLRQSLDEMAQRRTEEEGRNQNLNEEHQKALVNNELVVGGGLNIPRSVVTEQIITDISNRLFSNIRRVRSMVSPDEWQQWKDREARQTSSLKTKEDDKSEKRLHYQSKGSPRISFQQDTASEKQGKRVKYAKKRVRDNTPDLFEVLKNAVELIKHTALYCHEVIELHIGNVLRPECHNELRRLDETIPIEWIVDEIEPISGEYPEGRNALSIRLSNEAKEVIHREIELLRGLRPPYFQFHIKSPLFPLSLSPSSHYGTSPKTKKGEKPEVTRQSKTSPQQRRMHSFENLLKKRNFWVAGGYERLREDGIRQYYSGLIKDGLSSQDVIQRVQRFARYAEEKDAIRIISKMQKLGR